MSFAEQDDVFAVTEAVLAGLFREFAPGREIVTPFPRIPFREAMIRYGTDKPDLRARLELTDVTEVFKGTGFRAFADRHVRALAVPDAADQPRSFFDRLQAVAVDRGAQGLAWLRADANGQLTGPIAKHLTVNESERLLDAVHGEPGTAVLLYAGDSDQAARIMAEVRVAAAQLAGRYDEDVFRFCWIVDFPMYEAGDDGAIIFSHNPFSMPQGGLDALENMNPLDILAWQYDIVCNGIELSSGAVRNHRPEIMFKAFSIVGYSAGQVESEFGGMLKALRFGAPPHAGIAPGVDRIVMLLAGQPNIREIIAFPLNQNAQDLLMGAPTEIPQERLAELRLRIAKPGGQA
jgi:aspartyl-tRNA synthetase